MLKEIITGAAVLFCVCGIAAVFTVYQKTCVRLEEGAVSIIREANEIN